VTNAAAFDFAAAAAVGTTLKVVPHCRRSAVPEGKVTPTWTQMMWGRVFKNRSERKIDFGKRA